MFSWMNKVFESQFLVVSLSMLLQLKNYNFETRLNCLGFGLCVFQIALYGYFFFRSFYLLNSKHSYRRLRKVQQMLYGYYGDLKEFSFLERESRPARTGVQRIRAALIRNYHFVGLLKKFTCAFVVINIPDVCEKLEALGVVHLLMLFLTAAIQPFNNKILNVAKVTSDSILLIYILTLFQIEKQFQRIKKDPESDGNSIRLYFEMGDFASNLIYSFVLVNFFVLIERTRQMVQKSLSMRTEEYKLKMERLGLLILEEENELRQVRIRQKYELSEGAGGICNLQEFVAATLDLRRLNGFPACYELPASQKCHESDEAYLLSLFQLLRQ